MTKCQECTQKRQEGTWSDRGQRLLCLICPSFPVKSPSFPFHVNIGSFLVRLRCREIGTHVGNVGPYRLLVNASFFESGEDQENIARDVLWVRVVSRRQPGGLSHFTFLQAGPERCRSPFSALKPSTLPPHQSFLLCLSRSAPWRYHFEQNSFGVLPRCLQPEGKTLTDRNDTSVSELTAIAATGSTRIRFQRRDNTL